MTRKDYELIAKVFAAHVVEHSAQGHTKESADKLQAIGGIVHTLSRKLEEENSRFDRARFVTACGFVAFYKVGN